LLGTTNQGPFISSQYKIKTQCSDIHVYIFTKTPTCHKVLVSNQQKKIKIIEDIPFSYSWLPHAKWSA